MKVEELMLKDLILYKCKVYRVIGTDYLGSLVSIDREDEIEMVHIEEIEPIPLTPEILDRHGFKWNGFYWVVRNPKNDSRTLLRYLDDDDLVPERFIGHWAFDENYLVDHVHELQHALRLCGLIELADSFKV